LDGVAQARCSIWRHPVFGGPSVERCLEWMPVLLNLAVQLDWSLGRSLLVGTAALRSSILPPSLSALRSLNDMHAILVVDPRRSLRPQNSDLESAV
jgi:hypothetical protein